MLTLSKPQAHSYGSGDEVMGYNTILIELAIAAAGGYAYLNSKGTYRRDDIVNYTYENGVLCQVETIEREVCQADFWATSCDVGHVIPGGSRTENF